jgi:hypothetical protein
MAVDAEVSTYMGRCFVKGLLAPAGIMCASVEPPRDL